MSEIGLTAGPAAPEKAKDAARHSGLMPPT